jgi:hypothetical protein
MDMLLQQIAGVSPISSQFVIRASPYVALAGLDSIGQGNFEEKTMGCNCCEPGPWVQMPFDSADFTAGGSMVWTVERGDVSTCAYQKLGKVMIFIFSISATSTTGTASNELRIALPPNTIIMRSTQNPIKFLLGTNVAIGTVFASQGLTYLKLVQLDSTVNFPLLTNSLDVHGQITFEIE